MTQSVSGNFKELFLPPGKYFIRLKIDEVRGVKSLWSKTVSINVNNITFFSSPELISPSNNSTIDLIDSENRIDFIWEEVVDLV